MICHVAAAVGLFERNAGPRQHFFGSKQIFAMRVAAHGDYVRVFGEEESVADQARFATSDELLLNGQSRRPTNASEVADLYAAGLTHQALIARP